MLAITATALLGLAGCVGGGVSANPSNDIFSIAPGSAEFDTNCTGCNGVSSTGAASEQFTATLATGGKAPVVWSVSGGDATSGPGSITPAGLYTPPTYLTADSVQVFVKATLSGNEATPLEATSVITVTPGFLQPLTPENAALTAGGTLTFGGYIAEAGGSLSIDFALSSSSTGVRGGHGSLGTTNCHRSTGSFTWCSVTYTAPSSLPAEGTTWLVARIGNLSHASAQILLNTGGITSNPLLHQGQQKSAMLLGSSGGNNKDYDVSHNRIVDCCSGTLGALLEDNAGHQYLLGNNHVLARTDRASAGEIIVQPGLIDNNCTPHGENSGTTPVGTLTTWLPLASRSTNVDAAIALVNSRMVSANGSILELGAQQANGRLAAAPPGISSSGGKGQAPSLALRVAKSGRTTGLTCGAISAVSLDVEVSYFSDCAESKPYLKKTFTNQIAISGNQFSDAGDSGALIVDVANAEPVGLLFAGGSDSSGVGQSVANPVADVLGALGARTGASYRFAGTTDHAVNCLNYGNSTMASAQKRTLTSSETARAQKTLLQARLLIGPSTGILGAAAGKSSDHPGEGAVIFYFDENSRARIPAAIGGLRTIAIPTTVHAIASGTAPKSLLESGSARALSSSVLSQAIAVKQKIARGLLQRNPAFFAVGVGQSLDNPADAALVIYVDRRKAPGLLPALLGGLRTRYIVMDRFHVTRSYATPVHAQHHCMAHPAEQQTNDLLGTTHTFLKIF